MAIDTVFQTVPTGADAAMHGRIALMQNHVHMVAAHFSDRLDALPGFFNLYRGRKPAVRSGRQARHDQQDGGRADGAGWHVVFGFHG